MSKFVFDLIKTLGNREKAHFRKYMHMHSSGKDKNYTKLYDEFDKMKCYDKEKLASRFKGTSIEKYLSSEVNYLKEKILTSILILNLNNSTRSKILKGILIIEALVSKGFRTEALRKLKYFKKLSIKLEEFPLVLRLIELEETILFKGDDFTYKDTLRLLSEERNLYINLTNNLNQLHILREEIRNLQFTERYVIDDYKKHEDLYRNPLIERKENSLSKNATEHWHFIQVVKNFLVRDYQAALMAAIAHLNFMNNHQHLFPEVRQVPILSNYIYLSALCQNKVQFQIGREKLKKFRKENKLSLHYFNYIIIARQLEFAFHSNDLKLMEKYLYKSVKLIRKKTNELDSTQVGYLFSLIVRSCIILRKIDLGATFINQWYQRKILSIWRLHARLFSIIIHFELGWIQLLESDIISLKKLKTEFMREEKIIGAFYLFVSSFLKNPDRKSNHVLLLQQELKSISLNKKANYEFIRLNYYDWSMQL